jgi:pentatricopeptide repeat protein
MSKDQMTVRIIKQIVREFWIPCLIGVVWASYRISLSQKDAISTFIINFASAFFLASWGIGQIVRIRRQQGIEDSFSDVRKHLADVRKTTNSTLDIATELRLHLKNLPELEILAKNVSSPVIRTQPWVAASHRPSITEETIASETAPEFTPFNALISKSINEEAAERWYREMLKSGVRPNEITFSTLISKAATEEAAEQWYHEMLRSGVRPDEITFSTLISKAASEEAAERWYHESGLSR